MQHFTINARTNNRLKAIWNPIAPVICSVVWRDSSDDCEYGDSLPNFFSFFDFAQRQSTVGVLVSRSGRIKKFECDRATECNNRIIKDSFWTGLYRKPYKRIPKVMMEELVIWCVQTG